MAGKIQKKDSTNQLRRYRQGGPGYGQCQMPLYIGQALEDDIRWRPTRTVIAGCKDGKLDILAVIDISL